MSVLVSATGCVFQKLYKPEQSLTDQSHLSVLTVEKNRLSFVSLNNLMHATCLTVIC